MKTSQVGKIMLQEHVGKGKHSKNGEKYIFYIEDEATTFWYSKMILLYLCFHIENWLQMRCQIYFWFAKQKKDDWKYLNKRWFKKNMMHPAHDPSALDREHFLYVKWSCAPRMLECYVKNKLFVDFSLRVGGKSPEFQPKLGRKYSYR